jgi:hypothetical protein
MNAVPFTMDVFAGLGKCEGILREEPGHLVIEYQSRDAIAGIVKSDVRSVTVALKDLASVTITKGWLGTSWMGVKIELQGVRMESLKDVPGMCQGKVVLGIARKDRDAAERFVAGLHEATDA